MTNSRHSEKVEHTHGCEFKQRGAMCTCGAWEAMGIVIRYPFAAEMSRAMSRGFDYSQLIDGLAEGIQPEEQP